MVWYMLWPDGHSVWPGGHSMVYGMFVCDEVLPPSQELRSCRAGQLPINTVPGQA